MKKNLGLRAAIAGILIVIGLIYLTPSILKTLPGWWAGFLPKEKIRLGLDLQGGMHLTLEVDAIKAVESSLERNIEELRSDMRKKHIRYADIKRVGSEAIELRLFREKDINTFKDLISRQYPDFTITPSPTGQVGAIRILLKPKIRERIMKLATDQALETIRNRIDQFGVTEPDIRPQSHNRILIQLPGIKDPERAIALIGKTARLEFKLVDDEHSVQEALKGNIPPAREILYQITRDPQTGITKKIPYLLKKRTLLTGEYITDARVQIESQFNQPYVSISFDARGARLFDKITAENVGKRLAIVLDNHVYSAPEIRERISGGRAQITGNFTMEEAKDLAIVLRAGALPAPVKILEKRTVGPSLGRDSIEKGFKSMLIGGVLVVLFIAFYYKLFGLIADMALLLNVFFIMAGLALFGATLTLPGIAGIILTIGMAVDANVLIFERIREELREGKPPITAIDNGYSKAFVTILDANVTTFIAALVLFQFGTGPVRGFAVTLSIGIVASFTTAVFMTRIVVDYLIYNLKWKQLSI